MLLKRRNTGWHDGDYDLVAGHIDGNESLTESVCREAFEEIGIKVDPASVTFAHLLRALFKEDGKEYFDVYFEVDRWSGTPSIMEPKKCDDLQWFQLNDLPSNLTPSTEHGIKAYISKNPYAEFGFNT